MPKYELGDKKLIQGKGIVPINGNTMTKKLLCDVYYVPSLSQNFLSVGQLMAFRYSIIFDNVTCVLKKIMFHEL